MRSAARQIARLVPLPRSVRPRLLELSTCPHCTSHLVQPEEWQAVAGGKVSMTLRCPDCQLRMSGTFSAERARELNRAQAGARAALRTAYESAGRRNMHSTLRSLVHALELDLIGADDFASPLRTAGGRALPGAGPRSRPPSGA